MEQIDQIEETENQYRENISSLNSEIEYIKNRINSCKIFIDKVFLLQDIYNEKINFRNKDELKVYNSLFVSIFITYGNFFNQEYRLLFLDKLNVIFKDADPNLATSSFKTFHIDKEIRYELFKDNIPQTPEYFEIINMYYMNYPIKYIIDPQLLFIGWFKTHHNESEYRVTCIS